MSIFDKLKKDKPKSIYERIVEVIKETGSVPYDFEAEHKEYKDNELRFAPGAMDGILSHHANAGEDDFVDKFKQCLKSTPEKAMKKIDGMNDLRTSAVYSGLIDHIFEHKDEFDPKKIAETAVYFAMNSTKTETVKLGLVLFALFDFSDNLSTRDIMLKLGCCEEFTRFASIAADNSLSSDIYQEMVFEWAKMLHGWGKIEAVENLEPSTEEIKHWILCNGCENAVLPAYLGLVCAEKCGLYERLKKGGLSDEEFNGACVIMEGLLDEGPCIGLSGLEEPVEFTLLFLDEMAKRPIDKDMLFMLTLISDYFENKWEGGGAEETAKKINELTEKTDIEKVLKDGIKDNIYVCLQSAKKYDIDLSKELIELMSADFGKYCSSCWYLFGREKYIDEFFELCDKNIDESIYPRGMGEALFPKLSDGAYRLDGIVQYFGKYPLKGKKIIDIALNSPVVSWRNMAVRALTEWTKQLGKPLKEIDADLYNTAERIRKEEVSKSVKENFEKLFKE